MEDVQGVSADEDLDAEALAGLAVVDGDEYAIVTRAPQQADIDAVVDAAVELAERVGDGGCVGSITHVCYRAGVGDRRFTFWGSWTSGTPFSPAGT